MTRSGGPAAEIYNRGNAMRSCLALSIRVIGFGGFLLLTATTAHAQCGVNTRSYGQAGIVAGNPFQAEIEVTSSNRPAIPESTIRPRLEMVARDGQGRVREERVSGKFKRDTGPETGTEAEERFIDICDPTAETLTRIDTLNATAKIIHARPSAASRLSSTRTFCSMQAPFGHNPNVSKEDLGDQIIEGVPAHGVRITIKSLLGGSDASAGESITEVWCSDELAAVVLRTTESTKTGFKTAIAMRKIERTEPDPALFQIPAGYAVTESVAPAGGIRNLESGLQQR
jgi:hypothetical protein